MWLIDTPGRSATSMPLSQEKRCGVPDGLVQWRPLKEKHGHLSSQQQCHLCKVCFLSNTIYGHYPCVEQDGPVDYEAGFDAGQLNELNSPEAALKRSSSAEACWEAIFRILFPDWPQDLEVPSAYQTSTLEQATNEAYEVSRRPDTLAEMETDAAQGGAGQVVDRIFAYIRAKLGFRSIINSPPAAVEEETPRSIQDPDGFTPPSPMDMDSATPSAQEQSFEHVQGIARPQTSLPFSESFSGFYESPSQFLPLEDHWQLVSNRYQATIDTHDYDSSAAGLNWGAVDTQGYDSPAAGPSLGALSSPAQNGSDDEEDEDSSNLFAERWA
ncbi:hypothetical protein QBC35DRAFT_465492 [Podospora australis]|uniref:Uncharacterized protein n=1 Tax=Podospora australis TaxID=1536484 RepID=A0AAN7AGZ0_9PEZI|nr:hypothetical protein QBC35DRAFT_465492 [Podospora australis]